MLKMEDNAGGVRVEREAPAGLLVGEKFLNGQTNILCNFAQKDRRNIPTSMKWNGCGTTILVTILTM